MHYALNSRWSLRLRLRSEYKAVVYWSRFTALLRKKLNSYRRRDRLRRSLSGWIIPTYNNSCPETSACFIIIILELLLKLTNIVPTPVTKTKPTISTKVSEHAPPARRRCQFALVAALRSELVPIIYWSRFLLTDNRGFIVESR